MRSTFVFAVLASVGMAVVTPPAGAEVPSPGSVLIFPVQRSGLRFFSVISVTNTNTEAQTPNSFGGSTRAHFQYVNTVPDPDDLFHPVNCLVANRSEFLTPADTITVNAKCHNAVPDAAGFLIVSAQSPQGGNWSHDYLVGSELVVTGGGGSYSLEAIPLGALTPPGSQTELNGNGRIDFDGAEYEGLPDLLFIDSFVAAANWNLTLLNLTGAARDVNTVQFTVWNDNEFPLSTQLTFNCWFEARLSQISGLFTQGFLRGTPHDPDEFDIECLGQSTLETGWARIDSIGVRTPGGTLVSSDGALLGALTSSQGARFDTGRLLWGSRAKQLNGSAGGF